MPAAPLLLGFEELLTALWLSLRVGGMWVAIPVFGSAVLPARLRVLLIVATTVLLAITLHERLPIPEPSTPAFWVGAVREILIGLMLGFTLRLAFEAMLLAAELISLAMGLGFAQLNDPLRGTSAPVLGQLFSVATTLVFLTLEGHLRLLEGLLWSYVGPDQSGLADDLLGGTLAWSGFVFTHAVQVAMPALFALLLVNLGFGVISRSAPSLNLLAVGFPAALLIGILLLLLLVPAIVEGAELAIAAGLALVESVLG